MTEEEKSLLDEGANFHVSRETIKIHDDAIIDNINKCVDKEDVLWLLGDFCFAPKQFYWQTAKRYRDRINCKHINFIWGNHDDRSIASLFESVHDLYHANIFGQEIVLCHYAMAIWNKSHRHSQHYYGHSHANAEERLDELFPGRRSMDVGIDNAYKILGEYRPFEFSEIRDIMATRKGIAIDHHDHAKPERNDSYPGRFTRPPK